MFSVASQKGQKQIEEGRSREEGKRRRFAVHCSSHWINSIFSEEQRLKEEEEQRQQEEERLRREEELRLKAIEEARFADETSRLDAILMRRKEQLNTWQEKREQKLQVCIDYIPSNNYVDIEQWY